MKTGFWVREFPAAVTVCDLRGKALEMNRRSEETFAAYGGAKLLGTNLLDCHPAAARRKMKRLLSSGRSNVYTISKKGCKKIILQLPWYRQGRQAGLVEISAPLPRRVPHFIRKG
ncbi:MAG: hypothetical protein WCU88_07250 [Elusimicrobiota bacterium]|jgi:hypothetical protein